MIYRIKSKFLTITSKEHPVNYLQTVKRIYHSCSCPHALRCVSLPIYYTSLELLLIWLRYYFLAVLDTHCTLSVISVVILISHSVIRGVLVCPLGRFEFLQVREHAFLRLCPQNISLECKSWMPLECINTRNSVFVEWTEERLLQAMVSFVWYDRKGRPGCFPLKGHSLVSYPGHV